VVVILADEMDPDNLAADGLYAQLQKEAEAIAKKYSLDSAAIFFTWRTNHTGTRSACAKAGNYYATLGAVQHWLIRESETERINQRRYLGEGEGPDA
jgi:hypothetical protein